jgi:hypothetical protein
MGRKKSREHAAERSNVARSRGTRGAKQAKSAGGHVRGQLRGRRTSFLPWAIGVGVLVIVAGPIVFDAVQRANLPGRHVASLGHAHIAETARTPRYNSNPPTSGPHYATVAPAGSYVHELPDPVLVHNMEDGHVVLWHRMGDAEHNALRIRQYEEAAAGFRQVVIVPRTDLEHEFALTAWQRIDTFDEFDAERVRVFLHAFEGVDNHPRR